MDPGTLKTELQVRDNYVPLSKVIGGWCDLVCGVKWETDHTGWVTFAIRAPGQSTYTVYYDVKMTPTAQLVSWQAFINLVDEKQGGYFGLFSGPNPVGWQTTYFLRGLTLHATQADAEASL